MRTKSSSTKKVDGDFDGENRCIERNRVFCQEEY